MSSSDSRALEGNEDGGRVPEANRKRRADSSLSSSPGAIQVPEQHELHAQRCAKVFRPTTQSDADITENERREGSVESDHDVWPEPLHRSLVEAIFEVGLKHASPAVIMEKMEHSSDSLTSERVKSHLQKYRNNKEKNKEEFMNEYDNWMRKAQEVDSVSASPAGKVAAQTETGVISGPPERYHGGERAAYLSYLVLHEQRADQASPQPEKLAAPRSYEAIPINPRDEQIISFPTLTEEEQRTPLGESINQVMGLVYPVVQCIVNEREKKKKAKEHNER